MDQTQTDKLLKSLTGAKELSPLELNEMRFSGKKTVLTPARLRRSGEKNR